MNFKNWTLTLMLPGKQFTDCSISPASLFSSCIDSRNHIYQTCHSSLWLFLYALKRLVWETAWESVQSLPSVDAGDIPSFHANESSTYFTGHCKSMFSMLSSHIVSGKQMPAETHNTVQQVYSEIICQLLSKNWFFSLSNWSSNEGHQTVIIKELAF